MSNNTTISVDDLVYAGLTLTVSTLSLFGSVLIILTYIMYGDLRTIGRKLLVYLSVADLLTAVGNILGVVGFLYRGMNDDTEDASLNTWLCIFPAALTIFSTIASFSWTVCIAVFLYFCIVLNKVTQASRFIWGFHATSWLVPATVTLVSIFSDVLGRGTVKASWCWIKSSIGVTESVIWSFMTGPTWELLAVILSFVFYAMIKWHIRKEIRREGYISHETLTVISHANRKMTFVPIIFVLLRVWGLLRFLVNIHGDHDNLFLKLMQGIGDSGQGLANMILFCFFTTKIRRRMVASVKSLRHSSTCDFISRLVKGKTAINTSSTLSQRPRPGKDGTMKIGANKNDDHSETTSLLYTTKLKI